MPGTDRPRDPRPAAEGDRSGERLSDALGWMTARLAEALAPSPAAEESERQSHWGPDAASSAPAYWRWEHQWRQYRLEHADTLPSDDLPTCGPTLSIVVPVDRPTLGYLRECVQSVIDQTYQDWEVWLCGRCSEDPEWPATMAQLAAADERIRVSADEGDGGARMGVGQALAAAGGEFVALVAHGDLLDVDALARVAAVVTSVADADVIYSDEDELDDMDRPCRPHFKPDWDPDLLLSYPYLGHLTAIRRDVLRHIGGLRPEFGGGQDFDVMLRATEVARRVVHIPKVLYRRRIRTGEGAGDAGGPDTDPGVRAAWRRALEDAVVRRGIAATVEDASFPGAFHVRRRVLGSPTVSIVIPYRDQAALTATCLESLERAPGYRIDEVVLVDNASTEPETQVLRWQLESRPATRVIDYPGPFNWAAINNAAAATCTTDLLLFMNNDIEATSDGWLHALVELGQRPEIGAVGARLVYPDGSLQHAGVVLGTHGIVSHVFNGLPAGRSGYSGWDQLVRSWSAVTGACMLVRREVFEALGGFDEGYPVAFNDADFCIRLGQAGYRVLCTPHAELTHYESVSRGLSGYSADYQRFLARWGDLIREDDPNYSPNLGRRDPWCPLRAPGEDEEWLSLIDGLVPVVTRTGEDSDGDPAEATDLARSPTA